MTPPPLNGYRDNLSAGQWYGFVAAILVLSLGLRLYAAVCHPATPLADEADYHRLATELSLGHGYVAEEGSPTAWRPCGYPLVLAGVYLVAGPSFHVACIVQAFVGGVSVLLLITLVRPLLGRSEALVAGLLAALYPGLFWLPRVLLSENLALPLLLAALCQAVSLLRAPRAGLALALGVILGLGILMRGANVLISVGILVGLLGCLTWRRQFRRGAVLVGIIGLAMLATLGPWIVRNYQVFHRFIPVATQEGMAVYASYWPPRQSGKMIWGNLPGEEDPAVAAAARSGNEADVSASLRAVALRRLARQPAYFFRLIPLKLVSLAAPFDWEWFPHAPGTSRSLNLGYILLLVPALGGCILLLRRPPPESWLLGVLPAAVLVQSVVFYGSPRFRLPAEAVGLALAAVSLCWLATGVRRLLFPNRTLPDPDGVVSVLANQTEKAYER